MPTGIQNILLRINTRFSSLIHNGWIKDQYTYWILFLIIASTAVFRLSTLHSPAIDRTAWKEIDYIMISKNYYLEDSRFLYPRVSWPAEKPAITAMELPIVPYLAGLLHATVGVSAFSVRCPTLLAFLLLILYSFKLASREAGRTVGLLTAFFTALLPLFSAFRNFLFSEPSLLFFSVFTLYQFAQWNDFKKRANLIGFILGFSIAVGLKPTALYLLLPLCWMHYRNNGFEFSKWLRFAGVLLVAGVIPALWYLHAFYLATTYIDVFGVFGGQFGGHDKLQTLTMLRDPNWYRIMLYRLQRLCLGYPGLSMMAIGVLLSFLHKSGSLYRAYLAAIACFFIIVAEGQLDAPYRQLTIIPPASFFLALGTVYIWVIFKEVFASIPQLKHGMWSSWLSVIVCCWIILSFPIRNGIQLSFRDAQAPIHTDHWLLAQEIRRHASDHSKIIMAGEYSIHKGGNDVSPVTYYYSGVTGWTIQEGEWSHAVIDSLIHHDADLFGAIYYKREPELEVFLESMRSRYKVLYDQPDKHLLLLSLESD